MIVACQVMDPGSIPGERIFCSNSKLVDSTVANEVYAIFNQGGLAQMVERMVCIHEAQGSIPWSSIFAKYRQRRDLNSRGHSPTDFESVSLTTRTRCHRHNPNVPRATIEPISAQPVQNKMYMIECRKSRCSKSSEAKFRFWDV